MKIVEIARGYIGEFEKPGNMGFKNPKFEEKMRRIGFDNGEAWCSLFAELCYREAYPELDAVLDKLFHESVMQTYTNFTKAGYKLEQIPSVGSLMIMRRFVDGKPGWQGHTGPVVEVINSVTWRCVEGNTNAAGGREGEVVAEKGRTFAYPKTGLHVVGFLKIPK